MVLRATLSLAGSKTAPALGRFALASALLVVAGTALAEKADRDKPINFEGRSGGFSYESKTGDLTGNVVLTQGTMTIRGDRIVFKQNADNSVSATVYGNPLSFREKRDGVNEYYEAFAQRAEYDGANHLLELFDRALLKKGSDEIRSNYISYNTETEFFKAEGRPDAQGANAEVPLAGRVRGVFQPQAKDAADGKGGKAAPRETPKIGVVPPLKTDPMLGSDRAK
jgi:lipopolysaccharide export system protein LptA